MALVIFIIQIMRKILQLDAWIIGLNVVVKTLKVSFSGEKVDWLCHIYVTMIRLLLFFKLIHKFINFEQFFMDVRNVPSLIFVPPSGVLQVSSFQSKSLADVECQ